MKPSLSSGVKRYILEGPFKDRFLPSRAAGDQDHAKKLILLVASILLCWQLVGDRRAAAAGPFGQSALKGYVPNLIKKTLADLE